MSEDDINQIIAAATKQPDPLQYLADYLEIARLAPQGAFFYSQLYAGIALHTIILVSVALATLTRYRKGHLWLTRPSGAKVRLNATLLSMLFVALYSAFAIGYTAVNLYQQSVRRYVAGTAAFELSSFSAISAAVSVCCFTYHQSLPVGFDALVIRKLFRKQNAATDGHVFSFTLLLVWLVVSTAGIMVAPIVYDYWLRKTDCTLKATIDYLNRDDVRKVGITALTGLTSQVSDLAEYSHKAEHAMRVQVLVYMSICALYASILAPVGYKLIRLLDAQIASLHRAADDFFRLGSRFQPDQGTQVNLAEERTGKPEAYKEDEHLQENPRGQNIAAIGPTSTITCHNCNTEVAVQVQFDTTGADTRPKRQLKPRFKPPEIPLGADFPLVRAKKLRKVRGELLLFSIISAGGTAAFVVACAVLYTRMPTWSAAELMANTYTIFLWHYFVPASALTVAYVYLSLTLPSQVPSSAPSTPDSRASSFHRSDKSFKLRRFGTKSSKEADFPVDYPMQPMPAPTRRTQPTYPRAPSSISGMTDSRTEGRKSGRGVDPDNASDYSNVYVPPVPHVYVTRGNSTVRRWVGETTSAQELLREVPAPAPVLLQPPRRPRKPRRSTGPVSQTQSWLVIDEDD